MPHSFTNLLTHIIFSTHGRVPHLDNELKPRMLAYLGGIVRDKSGKALAMDGDKDHVHLLVSVPAVTSVAELVRLVKADRGFAQQLYPACYQGVTWEIRKVTFALAFFFRLRHNLTVI